MTWEKYPTMNEPRVLSQGSRTHDVKPKETLIYYDLLVYDPYRTVVGTYMTP